MRIENMPCSNWDGDVFDVNVVVGTWPEIVMIVGDDIVNYSVEFGSPKGMYSAIDWDTSPLRERGPSVEYLIEPFQERIISLIYV